MPDMPSNEPTPAPLIPECGLTAQLLDFIWQPRPGIILTHVKTYGYGVGSEYVYCYSYATYLEMAELKREQSFRIKVGMATDDPIARIYGQVAGNKTAISESPIVLFIFKTLAARHLERWFHKRLKRASGAAGSEWFCTNQNELLDLFQEYVRFANLPPDEAPRIKVPTRHRAQITDSDSTLVCSEPPAARPDSTSPCRATGQHKRDASGKSAKDHVLLFWIRAILDGNEPDAELWAQQFGVESRTVRSWMSCWRNYKGTTFTGTEGWPRITHSILNDVLAAITKASL